MLAAGGGWWESSDEVEGTGDARAESAPGGRVVTVGDCNCEGGDSDDELPEAVACFDLLGESSFATTSISIGVDTSEAVYRLAFI